ncbi:hypothetical protein KSP40_PGU012417 [Platanthera guangdongensis]|uniref:Uncharacterized protein n=1 Tax=Platanthera guangdongensis TaxID=2320717 RepID=A0ABR2MPC8_9ASPA
MVEDGNTKPLSFILAYTTAESIDDVVGLDREVITNTIDGECGVGRDVMRTTYVNAGGAENESPQPLNAKSGSPLSCDVGKMNDGVIEKTVNAHQHPHASVRALTIMVDSPDSLPPCQFTRDALAMVARLLLWIFKDSFEELHVFPSVKCEEAGVSPTF